MSGRITLPVRMELLSDAIFGTGYSVPGGEDIAICRDDEGRPYLKGSTLKGLFRESLENWIAWTGGTQKTVDELLGAPGWDGLADRRRIHLSELRLCEPPAAVEECCGTRTFISLNERGTAENGTLRMASCICRGMTFAGEVDCARADEELVRSAMSAIKWAGTMRGKGFGRVRVTVGPAVREDVPVGRVGEARCIRYCLRTDSPVLITDPARSKDDSQETRQYIPGSAIRGMVISRLAQDRPEWFAQHKTELLAPDTRFLDALPISGERAALPAISGFYENREQTVFATVLKDGTLAPGLKRARLGSFCAIEGEQLLSWSARTQGVIRIRKGRNGGKKEMFQTRCLSAGQTFEGYIELDRPELAQALADTFSKTVWLGADRYGGFGKCSVLDCRAAQAPAWRGEYGYRGQEELGPELYLLAVSPFTMLDAAGEPCGLSTERLAEKLGVGRVEIAVCSTSVSEYGAYNRIWGSREAAVRMYDRGSIFKLHCDCTPALERVRALERDGLGIRRAEGFGQILFLRKALYEGISGRAAPEETCGEGSVNRAAAVRRARCRWIMETAERMRACRISASQLGTIQELCESAIRRGGQLEELEEFLEKNLRGRGAKHGSRFREIDRLVREVLTVPEGKLIGPCGDRGMEELIEASCGGGMTERLRLLCRLFDFSRREDE